MELPNLLIALVFGRMALQACTVTVKYLVSGPTFFSMEQLAEQYNHHRIRPDLPVLQQMTKETVNVRGRQGHSKSTICSTISQSLSTSLRIRFHDHPAQRFPNTIFLRGCELSHTRLTRVCLARSLCAGCTRRCSCMFCSRPGLSSTSRIASLVQFCTLLR